MNSLINGVPDSGAVGSNVSLVTTNFTKRLTSSETTAQSAFDKIDTFKSYMPFVSGRFYQSLLQINSGATFAITANRLYAIPFPVWAKNTFTQIGVRVSTAINGANIKFGIYSDTAGNPNSLLLDGGTAFTCTGTSAQDAYNTINQTLAGDTIYWLVMASDQAITVTSTPTTGNRPDAGSTSYSDARTLQGCFGGFTVSSNTVALPNTFPSITVTNNTIPLLKLVSA